jgi:hypothetical protein
MRTPTNGRLDTPTWQQHPHHRHTSHMILVNKVGKRMRTMLPLTYQNETVFKIKPHNNKQGDSFIHVLDKRQMRTTERQ